MRMVLALLVGLVLSAGVASATIPDDAFCSVTPCDALGGMLVCPNLPSAPSFSEFTVNVRNSDNEAIPDAFVEIIFGVPGNHFFCTSATLTGTTDINGNVTFNIAAGGCTMATDAVRIIANTVQIRTYDTVKSPDYDGSSDGTVSGTDFVVFGQAFASGAGGCDDFTNDGVTDGSDFVIFGQGWGHVCD